MKKEKKSVLLHTVMVLGLLASTKNIIRDMMVKTMTSIPAKRPRWAWEQSTEKLWRAARLPWGELTPNMPAGKKDSKINFATKKIIILLILVKFILRYDTELLKNFFWCHWVIPRFIFRNIEFPLKVFWRAFYLKEK